MGTANSITIYSMGRFFFYQPKSSNGVRWVYRNPRWYPNRCTTGFTNYIHFIYIIHRPPIITFSDDKKESGITIKGYIDDGLLTSRGTSEQICTIKVIAVLEKVEKWAYKNGLIFDSAKFETIHFSQRRDITNPSINLPPPLFLSDKRAIYMV